MKSSIALTLHRWRKTSYLRSLTKTWAFLRKKSNCISWWNTLGSSQGVFLGFIFYVHQNSTTLCSTSFRFSWSNFKPPKCVDAFIYLANNKSSTTKLTFRKFAIYDDVQYFIKDKRRDDNFTLVCNPISSHSYAQTIAALKNGEDSFSLLQKLQCFCPFVIKETPKRSWTAKVWKAMRLNLILGLCETMICQSKYMLLSANILQF